MKKCTRCKKEKDCSSFYKDKKGKDGYRSICKECEKERHSAFAKERWHKIKNEKGLDYWNSRANKLKQKANGTITGTELENLYKNNNGKCSYCKDVDDRFHFDHKKSIKNGGKSNIDNIQILCCNCNRMKGKVDNNDFITIIEKIYNNTRTDNTEPSLKTISS